MENKVHEWKTFKYKFERVDVRGFFNPSPVSNYQRIIEENSRKGWKFIQAFAPGLGGYGRPCYFDLIFERKIENARMRSCSDPLYESIDQQGD